MLVAKSSVFCSVLLSIILLILIPNAYPTNQLVITPYDRSPICQGPQRSSKIQFYSHNILTGPNQSVYEVANSSITDTSPSQFGLCQVFDIKITRDPDYNSQQLGRAQGFSCNADLRVLAYALYSNIVWTSGEYDGSTITILGRSGPQAEEYYSELSVVGGTRFFRCARGYLIPSMYSANVTFSEIYADYVCGV